MSSSSGSDNEFQGSPSSQGPAPTPGYGLDRSASNSPNFDDRNAEQIRKSRSRSVRSGSGGSRSASGSPASQRSHSTQSNRSQSVDSSHSQSRPKSRSASAASDKSRSPSAASNKSNRSRSGSSNRSQSSAGSNQDSVRSRSASKNSNRSRSASKESRQSHRSASGSHRSQSGSHRSRSGSHQSRSGSRHSRSASQQSRSASRGSARSSSKASRSNSPTSNRSRSGSPASNRSKSAESIRSKGSKSRSRSGSRESRSDRSRSRSKSQQTHNSKSNSPQLRIDGNSEGENSKRKRESSSESIVVKKKSKVIDSDSESDAENVTSDPKERTEEQSRTALFGDADDISSEEETEEKRDDEEKDKESADERRSRSRSDDENEARPVIEDDEEKEPEPEPIPETRIDVQIPKISCDLSRDIHFVKLPNFLSVETRPFDQETYEDEIDEEETLDEEGRARLKLKVENTIRWREELDKEGNTIKESNARFVRWSDGSLSLHLGSEIFDVYKQPLQGDHNHLFIRQGTGLQGQAVFRTKLSFRPHSTESFTHRKMTLSLADRSQKVSGIKIISQVGVDPDKDRKMLLKEEEQKLRQPIRTTKPRKRSEGGARAHHRESFREEEGSDEEGAISLNAIKNKYKSGGANNAPVKGGAIYSTDEDESDFEARRNRKTDKPKVLQDSESGDSD